jgi:pimeloyl-CoA synthetase
MLEAGGELQRAAVAKLRGSVHQFAFKQKGCRVVQLAFQVADQKEAADLVEELHTHVRAAINSPHANYVIQKVVEALPIALASFIVLELGGVAVAASCHRFGCRVVCRLVEHSAADRRTGALVEELLNESEKLCRHNFGHHVIQSILEHGLSKQRMQIVESLCADIPNNIKNRNSCYVIEKTLSYGSIEDQRKLANALLQHPESMVTLTENQFGCHIARALLRLPGEPSQRARDVLRSVAPKLRTTRFGSRLLEDAKVESTPETA